MTYSIRDMASLLGVSKSQVARDKSAGMPMTDAEAAREWRRAHHDVGRTADGRIDRPSPPGNYEARAVGGLASAAGEGGAQVPPSSSDDDDTPADTDTADYRRHRTERERIRKEHEQLELDRARGLVIDLKEAQRLAFTAFRSLRDAGMSVPARLKDQLAATADAAQVERLLEAELAAVFAVDTAKLLAEADEEDDDVG